MDRNRHTQRDLEEDIKRRNSELAARKEAEREERDRAKDRRDSRRFWLTFTVAAIAALASLVRVLIQLSGVH